MSQPCFIFFFLGGNEPCLLFVNIWFLLIFMKLLADFIDKIVPLCHIKLNISKKSWEILKEIIYLDFE